ncbi:MAG: GGDEF domain-containing protein [Betaproteobacteria bacterium]|nr:GGDEF domain-containing protein [Betaproteobacteria bacterium]
MILFITWVVWYTDKLASPLLNAYLLAIITSALTLGKIVTLWEMVLIAACFVLLGDNSSLGEMVSLPYVGRLAAELAPMILVSYVTTMFSADIRYGLNKAMQLSEVDELTGVYNRRGFAMTVDRLFAQAVRYNRPVSIMMIDVDRLKPLNDSYGHETGDRMLKLVAKCIQGELRQTDVVARYGGDEFVALLPDTPRGGAVDVAARIRVAVAGTPLNLGDRSLITSVSIGVATYPEDGRSLETLLVHGDRAMYADKRADRSGEPANDTALSTQDRRG